MRLESYSEVEKIEEPVIYIYIHSSDLFYLIFVSNNKWKQIQNTCTFGGLPCRNSAFSGHQLDPLQLRDCQRDGRVSSLSGLS